ncbi:MAG: hypothetical protein KDD70_05445 [Bdellovibrionales bacterium]|nr:hypothetical protein [Bdellovibrionales bacterium]
MFEELERTDSDRASTIPSDDFIVPSPAIVEEADSGESFHVVRNQLANELDQKLAIGIEGKTIRVTLQVDPEDIDGFDLNEVSTDSYDALQTLARHYSPLATETAMRIAYRKAKELFDTDPVLQHKHRVIYTLFNALAHNERAERFQDWQNRIGTPVAFTLVDARSGKDLLVCPSRRSPYYETLNERVAEGIEAISRDLIGMGRVEELNERTKAINFANNILRSVFRFTQYGFHAEQVAKAVRAFASETEGVPEAFRTCSRQQIHNWTVGRKLPMVIRDVLKEYRASKLRGNITFPDQDTDSFCYFLGTHFGRVQPNTTTSQVGIIHESDRVIERVVSALNDLGIDEVTVFDPKKSATKAQREVRCRHMALIGPLSELTRDNTRLPWEYLSTRREKVHFLRGLVDSLAVVNGTKVQFTKQGGEELFKQVAVLLDELGIGSFVTVGDKTRLTLASLPDVQKFKKIVGKRYPEFDKKLVVAAKDQTRKQYTYEDYRLFERVRRAVGQDSPRLVAEELTRRGLAVAERDIGKWLKGTEPRTVQHGRMVEGYKAAYSERVELRKLLKSGVPRSQAFRHYEFGGGAVSEEVA